MNKFSSTEQCQCHFVNIDANENCISSNFVAAALTDWLDFECERDLNPCSFATITTVQQKKKRDI